MSESMTGLPATTGPYRAVESITDGILRVRVLAPTDGDDRVVWDQQEDVELGRGGMLFRARLLAVELNKHLGVSA
jgi:hypothetical protein